MMKKNKFRFIYIKGDIIRQGWIWIVTFHMFFMIVILFPFMKELKQQSLITAFIINFMYQVILIIAIWKFMGGYLRQSWTDFCERGMRYNIKKIVAGYFICIGITCLMNIIRAFTIVSGVSYSNLNEDMTNQYLYHFPIAFLILSVIIGPFTEECIYRGIIYQTFRKKNVVLACAVSGLWFGAVHVLSTIVRGKTGLLQIIILILVYAAGGVGQAIVQEKYRNIWINYFVHMLWNLIASIVSLMRIWG